MSFCTYTKCTTGATVSLLVRVTAESAFVRGVIKVVASTPAWQFIRGITGDTLMMNFGPVETGDDI